MENKQIKSFKIAIITIGLLMIFTYALTFFFESTGISFLKFIASPILVLGSDNSATIIAIIIFLLIIGGISSALNNCGFIEYMLNKISNTFKDRKYKLMYVLVFFFMALGALIGSFEEVVPLVPIVVALSVKLGFDKMLGIGMSLLAVGCGFASGIFNLFTIGVAQKLAGLPLFSGVSLRILTFVLIYLLLTTYLYLKAKKCEKESTKIDVNFNADPRKDKALTAFSLCLGFGFIIVIASPFLSFLQDYTMIVILLMFLVGGTLSSFISGINTKSFFTSFIAGVKDIAPSILLILMASSIKYIMDESMMIGVLLDKVTAMANGMNSIQLILFIYLICLVLELFVPSGSAKAFLLIPVIVPLAARFNISAQLCILAYAFGDGFSNVLYPTNPALLISLGLAQVDYKDWFKWSIKFQILNLLLTSLILLLGLFTNYQ